MRSGDRPGLQILKAGTATCPFKDLRRVERGQTGLKRVDSGRLCNAKCNGSRRKIAPVKSGRTSDKMGFLWTLSSKS
jgi:hypothetical protein